MTRSLLENYTIIRKLPENYVRGELDFCKNEFSYQTHHVKLIELNDCILNSRGFIYEEKHFKMNKISLLDDALYPRYFSVNHYLKKIYFRKKRTLDDHRYLLVHDDWSNAHYHWFCDLLPRLFILKDELKDYILLLPDTAYIRDIGLQSLEFFELRPAGIEFIKEKELVRVKNLSIVTHTVHTGLINDKIIYEMRLFILKKLKNDISGTNKLYVTRDRAGYRKVLNEKEVEAVVSDFGYDVIRFEDMSWLEQVAQAASAKVIVSMHGAGLVNALYLPPGGSLLEFRRDKIYHNQCFWHLSTALRINYYYLFGIPDNEDLVLEGRGCNLTIPTASLVKTLTSMENNI